MYVRKSAEKFSASLISPKVTILKIILIESGTCVDMYICMYIYDRVYSSGQNIRLGFKSGW